MPGYVPCIVNCMKWMLMLLLICSNANAYGSKALVYNGYGACEEGCAKAAKLMALRAGLRPVFVDENSITDDSSEKQTSDLFNDVAVWVQPGGYSSDVLTAISTKLRRAIENFVKVQGGGYIGFCAGAFTSTFFSGDTAILGFNLMSGLSLPYEDEDSMAIIPIHWKHKVRYVYFEGGPYLTSIDADTEVVATYANGKIAAARKEVGKGRVFVTGFHPEAPQWWRDFNHFKDPDGLDYDLVDEMFEWVMRSKRAAF
jgi:glutamine amidotransferase-like uncharacterized protein